MKQLLCIVVTLICCSTSTFAQKAKVVYHNYNNYEREILQTFKGIGAGNTFTSMPELKKQGQRVMMNSLVTAELTKPGKKEMSGEELVAARTPSVLSICKYSPTLVDPEHVQIGATAIVLTADGLCISNFHVFKSLIDPYSRLTPLDSVFFVATSDNHIFPIKEILSYQPKADLVFFRVDTRGEKLTPFPVGEDLAAGATVHALTHPLWHLYYYSKGVVARTTCGDPNDPFTNRTDITADYAKGSSGGPLFDDCGNLVGMVCTTQSIYYVDQPQTSLQMVIKSIIPISSIRRLIEEK